MSNDGARKSSADPANRVRARFAGFELDEANAMLLCDGKPVTLAPTPFAVLCALVRQAGALLTKNALLDQVWGHQFVSESALKTAISELRSALRDDARQPRFIETVSRRGYRFIAPATAASHPGPPRADSPQRSSFVGRAEPLSRLRAAWGQACNGQRAIVWLAGEPGIGKTTLIEHFVAGLGDVACVRGQCVEQYGGGEPYLPVLEALAELCRLDPAATTALRAVAPTWLLQLPWLSTANERDALRQELAGVGADRMLREMGQLLDRYTEQRPLLLVTEDLHWCDRATIQLIDFIARRRSTTRLMWLASFRLTEVVALDHPLNALRRELRLHHLCEEIVLDAFSEMELAEYLGQREPTLAVDEALVRALHKRTDGLPLFVASVTAEISARAGRGRAAAEHVARIAVPENLAAIIDHYIVRLGAEQRAVLSAAAVCGVEFRVRTIAAALERDAQWTVSLCEELAREQLWLRRPDWQESRATEPAYSFRHALFRQVLYECTAPVARMQLHGRIGSALERERADGTPVAAAELAMHFERGREPAIALRYYAEAAESALRRFSPAECMSLTERGLTLLDHIPEGPERAPLEISLRTLRGIAATQVLGVNAEAKQAFQRAYALLAAVPEHPMRRRLLYGLGFLLCLRADYAEALVVAERAEGLSATADDPILVLAACIVHAQVDHLQGRPSNGRTYAERGLALVQTHAMATAETFVADPQTTLLGLRAVRLLHTGLLRQGRACLEQAHTRARALGQPMARLVAIWFDALFEVRLGQAEQVAALAGDMRALVDEFDLAHGRNAWRWFQGWADARGGRPREGYQRIREAYQDNAHLGMLAGGSEVRGYAVEALVLAEDWDAAEAELRAALEFASAHEERVYLPQLYLFQSTIARARRDTADADACIRRALAEASMQQACWLELLALLQLCERGGATAADREALAAIVGRLPEAVDTRALEQARGLLGQERS